MTKAQMNQVLTEKLFGKHWNDLQGQVWPDDISPPMNNDYFTPQGMIEVLEKLPERGMTHYCIEDAGDMGHYVRFYNSDFSVSGDACSASLPEAVGFAAVEFLQKLGDVA